MKNQIHFLIFFVCLIMVGSLFVQSAQIANTPEAESIVKTQDDIDTDDIDTFEAGDGIEVTPIDTPFDHSGSATRSSARESPDYGNTYSNAHDLGDPPSDISGGTCNTDTDEDWFKVRLKGDDGSGGQVDNLTVRPTNLNTDAWWWWGNSWFQIFIFGTYDYGGPFPSNKLVFMDSKGYRPWSQYSGSDWQEKCYARAYRTGTYYIMVKAYFGSSGSYINYNLDFDVSAITPEDRNQVPESGQNVQNGKKYKVESERDLFDWYKVNSPTGKNYPINFSFKLEIDGMPSAWPDTDHFQGKTVHFFCEVIVLVFHDLQKQPIEILKGSTSNIFGLNETIWFSESTTEEISYVGVYVQMYGMDEKGGGPYYFTEHGTNADKYHGGFCTYKFDLSIEYIIQSVLVDHKVTPYRGRTYHDYTFSVMYKDENNKAPLSQRIKVDDRQLAKMELVGFNYTTGNYRDGAIFEYTINGVKLGEGLHHYTFYFKDPDGYSVNSLIQFEGPYITDNVEPQIRVTASDTLELMEDAPPKYIDLLEIFDDVEDDPLTFKLKHGANWIDSIETEIATYGVIDANNSLRVAPKANAYGDEIVTMNVTDTEGNWIEKPFEYKIKIIKVNDPPQIKKYLGEWKIKEDSKLTGIDLNDYFHDPIEPEDILQFDYDKIENIEVSLDAMGEDVRITPVENWYGETSIRFSCSDGEDTIYNVLRLNVEAVNDLPYFKNPRGFTINESKWFHLDMIAYDPVEKHSVQIETNLTSEVNNQLLRTKRIFTPEIGGVVLGENLIIETNPKNSSRHTFSFMPTNEMAGGGGSAFSGIYYINFTAVDSAGGKVTHNVIMTVMNVNQAPQPIINRPLNESAYFDDELVYFFGDAGDPDTIHGGHNFYTWSSDIDGLIGEQKYPDPRTLSPGKHTITLEVRDGELMGRTTIQVMVKQRFGEDGSSKSKEQQDESILGIKSSTANFYGMLIAIIVLVILMVAAVLFSLMAKKTVTKKLKSDFSPDELRLPEEVQKLLAPQKAICGHCGSVIQVVAKHRPISVTCQECNRKSVVYHPGHTLVEIPEAEKQAQLPEPPAQQEKKYLPPGKQ